MRAMRLMRIIAALLLLLLIAAALWWQTHGDTDPGPAAAPGDGELRLSWYGVSAVLVDDGERAVMVDPHFSRPEGLLPLIGNRRIAPDEHKVRAALAEAGIERLEAVLVSHSHFDHAMDAGLVARLTGARLIGSESTANIGRGAGLAEADITVVTPGEAVLAGPYRIRFMPSRHAGRTGGRPTGDIDAPLQPPARYADYRQGGTWSIHIAHPRGQLLHHGSAGFEPGALAGVEADAVVLGVAMIEDLAPYLREVVDAVGAQHVYAVHWDDFTQPLREPLRTLPLGVDLEGFFADMAQLRPALRVRTLPLGTPVPLCGDGSCTVRAVMVE